MVNNWLVQGNSCITNGIQISSKAGIITGLQQESSGWAIATPLTPMSTGTNSINIMYFH